MEAGVSVDKLRDVSPSLFVDYAVDGQLGDARTSSHVSLRLSGRHATADVPDLLLREPSRSHPRVAPLGLSALDGCEELRSVLWPHVVDGPNPSYDLIPHVVEGRACVQMCGVDARRVVAGVADVLAVGDTSVCYLVRDPVSFAGVRLAGLRTSGLEHSVAPGKLSGQPGPALGRAANVDFRPETFFECFEYHNESISNE